MGSNTDRKEAIRQFKEQKTPAGVYAVRCSETGQTWVGSFANLDAVQNRLWFCLSNGVNTDKTMQQAWNQHGEAAFSFEVLERLEDDLTPLTKRDQLKQKRQEWVEQLGAQAV